MGLCSSKLSVKVSYCSSGFPLSNHKLLICHCIFAEAVAESPFAEDQRLRSGSAEGIANNAPQTPSPSRWDRLLARSGSPIFSRPHRELHLSEGPCLRSVLRACRKVMTMKQYIDILNFTDCIEGKPDCNRSGIYVHMEACEGLYLAFLFRAEAAVGPIFSHQYMMSLPNRSANWLMLHRFRLAPAS